jgi:transposase
MPRARALRSDFDAVALRRLARRSREASQARRLLALAAIYDDGTRSEAARLGNVTLQIVRDWVVRFNAGAPDGLRDRKAPGPTPRPTDAHRAALAAQIDRGPIQALHGMVRWRLSDPSQWLWEEFRVSVSPQTLSGELRAMGYRKLSARPRHHAQAEGAIEAFKKRPCHAGRHRARAGHRPRRSRNLVHRRSPGRPEGQDHPPLGTAWQQALDTAGPALRPTYIFGAVWPREGKGAALVLPFCNTRAMKLHLAEISASGSPCRHGVLLLDQAGWHLSGDVTVPDNINLAAPAAEVPRAQRHGERLAVHARAEGNARRAVQMAVQRRLPRP